MRNFILKLCMTFIFLIGNSSNLFADTEGYDYYKTSNYVEFDSSCFSSGDELYMFDYETGNYHDVVIESVSCKNSGCDIEIYDYHFSEYRTIELEESMC